MTDPSTLQPAPISVLTSIGTLSLFPQRFRDVGGFANVPASALPDSRLRLYLPRIAARADAIPHDADEPRLDEDACRNLRDDDLERIAEAYLATPEVQQLAEGISPRAGMVDGVAGESAAAYLDRLLRANHERQLDDVPAADASLQERFDPPLTSAFATLDRNARAMREAATNFMDAQPAARPPGHSAQAVADRDANPAPGGVTVPPGDRDPFLEWRPIIDAIVAEGTRDHREREEIVELARGIGKLTAQSALLLADLSESTTEFLHQFATTARQSKETARKSVRIALALVTVATLLAAAAAAVSYAGYRQGMETLRMTEQLQESMLRTMNETAVAQESRFKSLDERMRVLSERQQALAVAVTRPPAPVTEPSVPDAKAQPRREAAKPPATAHAAKRKPTR